MGFLKLDKYNNFCYATAHFMSPKETKETQVIKIQYEIFKSPEDLPEDERELLEAAKQAMETAYSPYSNFKVGAAVRLEDGRIIVGSNLENASYGLALCAERAALSAANSQGRMKDVRKIAVIGTGRSFESTEPVTPCGGCRQWIKEFEDQAGKPIIIITSGVRGPIHRYPKGIDSLLPSAFGPRDLNLV